MIARREVVVLEGRDASGKTTTAGDLALRVGARRIALGPPSPRDRDDYFRRWLDVLARHDEPRVLVLDRSWYNRAGVERVMEWCTPSELEAFFGQVVEVEAALVRSGVRLVKLLFQIGASEQRRRLASRASLSAVDRCALARREAYDAAELEMLARTSTMFAPWFVLPELERAARADAVVRLLHTHEEGPWIARHCASAFDSSTSTAGSSASRSPTPATWTASSATTRR